MAAPVFFAARPINIDGHAYAQGDVVDTSAWSSNYLSTALRMGWIEADENTGTNAGSVIAAATLSTSYTVQAAWATIPGWQIVVPANSGTVEVGVAEGLLFNINTGTSVAGTQFQFSVRIVDEATAVVGYSSMGIYSSAATAQTWIGTVPLKKVVPNNAAAKTYSVQAQMSKVGTLGAASTIFTSQSGFTDPTLSAVRR